MTKAFIKMIIYKNIDHLLMIFLDYFHILNDENLLIIFKMF